MTQWSGRQPSARAVRLIALLRGRRAADRVHRWERRRRRRATTARTPRCRPRRRSRPGRIDATIPVETLRRRGRRRDRRGPRRRHGDRRRARRGLRGVRRLPRRRRRLPVATPTTSSCATGLVVDWVESASRPDVDRNVLSATCSRRHLGDLTSRFERANPPDDDLDERRSDSIAACIEPISPEAAANLPAEVRSAPRARPRRRRAAARPGADRDLGARIAVGSMLRGR